MSSSPQDGAADHSAGLEELNVNIEGDPPVLDGDPFLLTIVLQNLMINAAQATHGRGPVAVVLSAAPGWLRVDVSDRGPGIPPEVRAVLFRPFMTTKARGTGLGLATAKQIVEAHNGRISLDCPSEGGTIVSVELPSGRTA